MISRAPDRMKNHQRHPPGDLLSMIIILGKKDYFSKKKCHGISKNGERMGREYLHKEKGVVEKLHNPLILMVGQDRIELSTHGFSVRCSTD
jgi:hypothetical protein